MSNTNGQVLPLIAAGSASPYFTGSAAQWLGGNAQILAWAPGTYVAGFIEVSPDGGTTWINAAQFDSRNTPIDKFFSPGLMVRVSGNTGVSSANVNVTLYGYGDAS